MVHVHGLNPLPAVCESEQSIRFAPAYSVKYYFERTNSFDKNKIRMVPFKAVKTYFSNIIRHFKQLLVYSVINITTN